MIYYAKSRQQDGTQETLKCHLHAVAQLAEQYGAAFGQGRAASVCGMLHDFGKYSTAFQNVLKGTQSHIDHAIAGAACLFSETQKARLSPVMECVAAHHFKLISRAELDNTLRTVRKQDGLVTTLCGKQAALCGPGAYQRAMEAFQKDFQGSDYVSNISKACSDAPKFIQKSELASMLYTRMLFSCLIDADYTVSSGQAQEGDVELDTKAALENLYAYCDAVRKGSHAASALNQYRNALFERCGEAGEQEGGLFTLTAPTGTGKTLALLHFALRHCQYTGKRRIIAVLPFLTLIEQSAKIYQQIVPDILQDHSQCDFTEETREYASKWNKPFILTTSVQFFESLFSDEPTTCRKLHNIANSVILFDEAQSLPVSLLKPTLQAIQQLCGHYGCSVVFSTATQPDYSKLNDFVWNATEILPEHRTYYQALCRVNVRWHLDAPISFERIAEQMCTFKNVCAIVNLRAHARRLYMLLREQCAEEEIFLLSTELCPAHRTALIEAIKKRQRSGQICRVVATQCIEAGVDLDFERLYRALAPMEAIAQAAGRCNRNGNYAGAEVVVFIPPDQEGRLYPDDHYANAAAVVRSMQCDQQVELHNPDCISRYYQLLLGLFRGDELSKRLEQAVNQRNYQEVAKYYRLIEQRGIQVIVPYQEKKELYESIRQAALKNGLTKKLLREAAPLVITVYDRAQIESICEPLYFLTGNSRDKQKSSYYILLSGCEALYHETMGLHISNEQNVQNMIW